jgi:hypothetical protein
LKFRGDGLQSRYIASVLHYIAINSNDFYIWGYEEPEIALEYSHASKMAIDFRDKYSECAQIFLSTHSPAFIALDGNKISCYRAAQEKSETIVANIGLSDDLNDKDKLKEELGIIEIQREVHEYYSKELAKLNDLRNRLAELESEVDVLHRPLIVTEGKTDKHILDIALKKFGNEAPNVIVRTCDNAGSEGSNGGAGQLGRLIESIHPEDERLVIAVFDNDDEGQKEFNKLSNNFTLADWSEIVKKHKNRLAWAMLLPEPEFRSGFADAKNLCIEYLFQDEVLEREFASGNKLEFKDPTLTLLVGNQKLDETSPELIDIFQERFNKKYRKVGSGKDEFSKEVVSKLNRYDFSGFEKLFDLIKKITTETGVQANV